eukprot:97150-Amorphochlora_amoeboformis.AAC.4
MALAGTEGTNTIPEEQEGLSSIQQVEKRDSLDDGLDLIDLNDALSSPPKIPPPLSQLESKTETPPHARWLKTMSKLIYNDDDDPASKSAKSSTSSWLSNVSKFLITEAPSSQTPEAITSMKIMEKAKEVAERESEVMSSFALLNEERRRVNELKDLNAQFSQELTLRRDEIKSLKDELAAVKDDMKDRSQFIQFLREKHATQKGMWAATESELRSQLETAQDRASEALAGRAEMQANRDRAREDSRALEIMLNLETQQCERLGRELARYKAWAQGKRKKELNGK